MWIILSVSFFSLASLVAVCLVKANQRGETHGRI